MEERLRQERLTRQLACFLSGLVFFLLLLMLFPERPGLFESIFPSLVAVVISFILYRFLTRKVRRRALLRKKPFPPAWEEILKREVSFFRTLEGLEKDRFREEVRIFLSEKRITGIKTSVDDTVRLLVAASAIIPIFGFPGWEWDQISEVLIYPGTFNEQFEMRDEGNTDVLGMVGRGAMNRMMILSKPDLLQGFRLDRDRKNVGIHEFTHLLDKSDGGVDGVPSFALSQAAVVPWLKLVHTEMERMKRGQSDINRYGLTNEAEFFAVVSEYFFENPDKMSRKHPELYAMLQQIFCQNPRGRVKKALMSMIETKDKRTGRNSPCPCGSGKKYKKCCLNFA